jgi:hypothetical protein
MARASIGEGDIGFSGHQISLANKPEFIPYTGELKDKVEIFAAVFKSPEPNMKFDKVEVDMIMALWHGKRDPSDPPSAERNECNTLLKLLVTEVRTVVDIVMSSVK